MVYQEFYRFLETTANFFRGSHSFSSPSSCSFCSQAISSDINRASSHLCLTCFDALTRSQGYCIGCGHAIAQANITTCGHCLKKPNNYHRLIAACNYEFPVNKAISQIKFNRQWHLAKALTQILQHKILQYYSNTDLASNLPQAIVPIPLHANRLLTRGFNQSDVISKMLARNLSIKLCNQHLFRVINTPHQIGLKESQRKKNLKNAFIAKHHFPKHIAIIDDVVTTGTTVTEASKVCLANGAERIDIWCLAKT